MAVFPGVDPDTLVIQMTQRLRDPQAQTFRARVAVPCLFFWARIVLLMRRPFIVGVTGSVGKTTTTLMIATVLRHPAARRIVGHTAVTSNNMNDDAGLPLTVLRYGRKPFGLAKAIVAITLPVRALAMAIWPFYPRILVLEYGTHSKGYLDNLARLAPPDIAVVTTIGPAHLARLKTLDGVAREKSHVVRAVPPSGLVVLGQDHAHVGQVEAASRAPVVRVGGRGVELSENLARAVCLHLGIPEAVIRSALQDFRPATGRLNRLALGQMTVIDDSYNANPLSMRLGLDTLAATAAPGQRRLAFLGIMAELGDAAEGYHREIGTYARTRADVVVGVGELARQYNCDHWFESIDVCVHHLGSLVLPGDCLLIKGSAVARMDRLVTKLREMACQGGATRPAGPG